MEQPETAKEPPEDQPGLAPKPHANRGRLGPYSRKLARGALGELIDGRSAEGRFIRHLEAELVRHIGGRPTITQRLLIERLIRIRLQLDGLDEKLASGAWTPHDSRTYGGLLNAYRLCARELGLKATAERLDRVGANIAAAVAAGARRGAA